MVNLSHLREAIMDEENISLKEMEEIFEVSEEELFEAIKRLFKESKNDEKLFKRLEERNDLIVGYLNINRDNRGSVRLGENKYYVPSKNIGDALDKDLVILEKDEDDNYKVKSVVDRNDGLLIVNYIDGVLTPLHAPFNSEIVLSEEDKKKLVNNQRLVVKVGETKDGKTPATIDQIIGHKDDIALEENTVAVSYKFHRSFPSAVEKEVEELPDGVIPSDYKTHVDYRSKRSFTIDGEDTQDIDDGLFIEYLPNGHIILGVPISRVSKYIKKDSAIFKEACYRGTSWYSGDHSLPMLHRKLCNGIGSLNPDEDRISRTHLIEFDENFNIVSYRSTPAIIRSRKKMTYEAVDDIIIRDNVRNDYLPFREDLMTLYKISLALEKRKLDRGALDFQSQEVKPVLDGRMQAIGFRPLESLDARKIIENIAILVNELCDKDAEEKGIKNINRIELAPDPEKFNEMLRWIKSATGYDIMEIQNIENPREVSRILNRLKQDERYDAFSSLLLKAMPKAKYSTLDLGHYGLAYLDDDKYYAQVTSPIRRLGDLTNNMQLDDYDDGLPQRFSKEELEEIAARASFMEVQGDKATREMNKKYMAQFMSKHIGEMCEGRIMDIGSYGATVKTSSFVVGKVNTSDIIGGKYRFVKDNGTLTSRNGQDKYSIGDKVLLTAKTAHPEKNIVDFYLDGPVEAKAKKKVKKRK